MRRLLLPGLLSLLLAGPARAQSLPVLSQNPPALRWQEVRTPNFRVLYASGLDSAAQRTAARLEQLHGPGVATLGVRYRQFKLEGSNFTGREPDEHRYNFDPVRADSWAARLSWNPGRELALQASRAFIKSPEDLHPTENVTRTTASLLHSRDLGGPRRYLASALIWGMNEKSGRYEHAALAETNLTLGRPTFYGRYEFVQKDSEELGLDGTAVYNIHALTLGASYRLTADDFRGPEVHIGCQLTGYAPAAALRPLYGRGPFSASVYVRLNAPWMSMASIGGMKM